MIWTLKITLLKGVHAEEPWECTLAIDSSTTLEGLHLAILHTLNFENDHPYEFYTAKTLESLKRVRYEKTNQQNSTLNLNEILPLLRGHKLFYLFDFSDHWLFQISKTRHKTHENKAHLTYPNLVHERGIKPVQYPDWIET
jgi:hypothetical protein